VSEAKLRDYVLNPAHPQGGPKARVFAAVLGITRMTTAAERRKHAEKIQKDALQARLDTVQPLIDDLSKHETLAEKLAALQTEMTDLATTIGTHYRADIDGGWTAKELASAALDVPKTATRKRAPKHPPADNRTGRAGE